MHTHDMNAGMVSSGSTDAALATAQAMPLDPAMIAFRDGRSGKQPQANDLGYLLKWAEGFAFLVQEKQGWGLVPSMEWRQRSYVGRMQIEATNPDEGSDCPF